jgi:hypothetical protein
MRVQRILGYLTSNVRRSLSWLPDFRILILAAGVAAFVIGALARRFCGFSIVTFPAVTDDSVFKHLSRTRSVQTRIPISPRVQLGTRAALPDSGYRACPVPLCCLG